MATDKNWQYWHDEVADIPAFDDVGKFWYDAETGFRYDKNTDYRPKKEKIKKPLSEKAKGGREIAKFFGGVALKGTSAQVEWAEKIRSAKIQEMPEHQAVLCCDKNGLLKNAKFWIENRNKSGKEIGSFCERQKYLLNLYNEEKKGSDPERIKCIADEYNELTTKWGFL